MNFATLLADMFAYHRRTAHAPQHYAQGPAFLDWDSQPDPFRRFDGAPCHGLPLAGPDHPTPAFAQLDGAAVQPLSAENLGLFLELALGLSAWKEVPGSRWALRNNPSSGNLHPTEGWVILPPLAGVADHWAVHHYSPYRHGLEERCTLAAAPCALPPGGFLMALSSIPWREAWKYGERAFRYCQLDVGHALGAVAYAAGCLGWRVSLWTRTDDGQLSRLLGLDRPDAFARFETEDPDVLMAIAPQSVDEQPLVSVGSGQWHGQGNRLSADPDRWPAVEFAQAHTHRPGQAAQPMPIIAGQWDHLPDLAAATHPTGTVIRARRSAQRMDNQTGLGRDGFFRMLSRLLPRNDWAPWTMWPWTARTHAFVFVHRVEGLDSGLYALIRDPDRLDALRAACDPGFVWTAVDDCPLPLWRLRLGDEKTNSSRLSCLQSIAGHGAFSLAMIGDFARALDQAGQWGYRPLMWEAGLMGQILYLEATAAGLAGTGIGCFFDGDVLATLGLTADDPAWQVLYHFTVGAPLNDLRISSFPAYDHLVG